jgi:hypothetical protein
MGTAMTLLNWMFGIQSPSRYFQKFAKENIVKPMRKGIKLAERDFAKYTRDYAKFERKWQKKNASWNDTRQKKKALAKAFLKKYPQYGVLFALERVRII